MPEQLRRVELWLTPTLHPRVKKAAAVWLVERYLLVVGVSVQVTVTPLPERFTGSNAALRFSPGWEPDEISLVENEVRYYLLPERGKLTVEVAGADASSTTWDPQGLLEQ